MPTHRFVICLAPYSYYQKVIFTMPLTGLQRYGWNERGVWWICHYNKRWQVIPQRGEERLIVNAIDTFVHSMWCDLEFKKGEDETIFRMFNSSFDKGDKADLVEGRLIISTRLIHKVWKRKRSSR